MAAQIARLKQRREFLAVAAARRKWAARGLVLQVAARNSDARHDGIDADIRVGFTVSKKVGNAVRRNRAKRRLRAAAREVLPKHARPGFDYVIIGRAATPERIYNDLCDDLRLALKKVGAYLKVQDREA